MIPIVYTTMPGGRVTGFEELRGKGFGGFYVLSNPRFPKKWVKIGMADEDIERRIRSYTTYFPGDFLVHVLVLWKNNYKKYIKPRDMETAIKRKFKPFQVKGYVGQRSSEWLSLTDREKKDLTEAIKVQAKKHGGKVTIFSEQASINLP